MKNISVESAGLYILRDPENLELFASDRVKVDPARYARGLRRPRPFRLPTIGCLTAVKMRAQCHCLLKGSVDATGGKHPCCHRDDRVGGLLGTARFSRLGHPAQPDQLARRVSP